MIVWLLRALGMWLLQRFGAPILDDLLAGDRRGATRRTRRAGMLAVRVAAVFLLACILVLILLIALLIRLLN